MVQRELRQAHHSYIQITSPSGDVVIIEGNQVKLGGQSTLIAVVSGTGIPSDTKNASSTVEDGTPQTIPCAEANALEDQARHFKPVSYSIFAGRFGHGGYNSNSFMHWFLNLAGWVQYYANTHQRRTGAGGMPSRYQATRQSAR